MRQERSSVNRTPKHLTRHANDKASMSVDTIHACAFGPEDPVCMPANCTLHVASTEQLEDRPPGYRRRI